MLLFNSKFKKTRSHPLKLKRCLSSFLDFKDHQQCYFLEEKAWKQRRILAKFDSSFSSWDSICSTQNARSLFFYSRCNFHNLRLLFSQKILDSNCDKSNLLLGLSQISFWLWSFIVTNLELRDFCYDNLFNQRKCEEFGVVRR